MMMGFWTFGLPFAVLIVLVLLSRNGQGDVGARSLSRIEAKLDALLQHAGITFDPFVNVPAGVAEALARGEKIQAIKAYREATGVDLKTAKEYVEDIQRQAGAS